MFPVTLDCEELDRRHSENNLGHTLWIPVENRVKVMKLAIRHGGFFYFSEICSL